MNNLEIQAVKWRRALNQFVPGKKEHFVSAVVTAAGSGERMGGISKPMFRLCGKECLLYSLDALQRSPEIREIILTAKPDERELFETLCRKHGISKLARVACGGKTRQESVKAGFFAISEQADLVLIHDAARPLITPDAVKQLVADCLKYGAVCAAQKMTDTVKEIGEDQKHLKTISRDRLYTVQTPQVFLSDLYRVSLALAEKNGTHVTDDAALAEEAGFCVHLSEVLPINIKLTRPQDALILEKLLSSEESHGGLSHR